VQTQILYSEMVSAVREEAVYGHDMHD